MKRTHAGLGFLALLGSAAACGAPIDVRAGDTDGGAGGSGLVTLGDAPAAEDVATASLGACRGVNGARPTYPPQSIERPLRVRRTAE
ncbi:MAG TPA: hypothetical protein VHB21_08415, partial [Minicystis sp.]|nr:hypothetical protein [Minicystis sp.]